MADEKFTMEKGLEQLVQRSVQAIQLKKYAEVDPSERNTQVRRHSSDAYGNKAFLASSPAALLELSENHTNLTLTELAGQLDENTYKAANVHYGKSLDKERKAEYYVNLIKEGVLPEKPSDKLKKAVQAIRVADEIINALQTGDESKADAVTRQYLSELHNENIDLSALYGQGQSQRTRHLVNIAKGPTGLYTQAIQMLEKENLYGEIEKAINDPYKRAVSLTQMYVAYGRQQEVNAEAKKKAEAEKKKGGK